MHVTIVSVGKPLKTNLRSLIDEFEKRLRLINLSWKYITPSAQDPLTAQKQEAAAILKTITADDYVILLDEKGAQYTSKELSSRLFRQQNITLIIGGPFGVHAEIFQRANEVWSLSTLVFPHQIVRLIITEQLYRAEMIHVGHPYHHA